MAKNKNKKRKQKAIISIKPKVNSKSVCHNFGKIKIGKKIFYCRLLEKISKRLSKQRTYATKCFRTLTNVEYTLKHMAEIMIKNYDEKILSN